MSHIISLRRVVVLEEQCVNKNATSLRSLDVVRPLFNEAVRDPNPQIDAMDLIGRPLRG